ncbi:MAG TPA: hypothetical protein PJ991_00085 [Kiritimatiellia bacterium]|nr:hypothetical protein [Kiritimatiellia bacterium]
MKRALKITAIVLVLLFIVLFFYLGQVVENAINHAGPRVLGVPVSVEKARIFLLAGRLHITDLIVGNPEGFKTDNMFNMHELSVRFSPRSIFTDTIIVHEVLIKAPQITYEQTLTGNNVGALQKQLGGADKPKDSEPTAPGKKVVIERFYLTDGKVKLSIPGMMGTALPIPLPTIELKDIGKEKEEGASITDAISSIFGAIFSAIGDVVMSSGKLLGDGARLVGDGVVTAGGAVADGVSAVGRGLAGAVGSLFDSSSDEGEKSGENE